MVIGLDRFKAHFANFTDQYVLIGGAACTVAMDTAGLDFRATKDLDIVLCVEALSTDFVQAFWDFVTAAGYSTQEKSSGEKQFYRFQKPSDDSYPFMLELFSRAPDAFKPAEGSHLTPIPMEEEVSSLSAILMNDDYYQFLLSGMQTVDGLQVAGAEILIPLKARAWLDLTERERAGDKIDSKEIKKHKNDVFRLLEIVDPERVSDVPQLIRNDLANFLRKAEEEGVDFKALKLGFKSWADAATELRRIYGID